MVWFVLYLLNLRRAFRMLLQQSYTGYLDANISIRLQARRIGCRHELCYRRCSVLSARLVLQARGIIMPYFVVFITLALTGFIKRANCLYYITDAYGNSAFVVRRRHTLSCDHVLKHLLSGGQLSPSGHALAACQCCMDGTCWSQSHAHLTPLRSREARASLLLIVLQAQIAFTTVAVVNVLLYMPVRACDHAMLQVWNPPL